MQRRSSRFVCPHCSLLHKLFIYSWKDKTNPFRLDEKLAINCVPTLIEYPGGIRLEDNEITEEALNNVFNK